MAYFFFIYLFIPFFFSSFALFLQSWNILSYYRLLQSLDFNWCQLHHSSHSTCHFIHIWFMILKSLLKALISKSTLLGYLTLSFLHEYPAMHFVDSRKIGEIRKAIVRSVCGYCDKINTSVPIHLNLKFWTSIERIWSSITHMLNNSHSIAFKVTNFMSSLWFLLNTNIPAQILWNLNTL